MSEVRTCVAPRSSMLHLEGIAANLVGPAKNTAKPLRRFGSRPQS
jgi:hypothetical protein